MGRNFEEFATCPKACFYTARRQEPTGAIQVNHRSTTDLKHTFLTLPNAEITITNECGGGVPDPHPPTTLPQHVSPTPHLHTTSHPGTCPHPDATLIHHRVHYRSGVKAAYQ